MNYEEQLRRQWEVNIYNDLGFLCDGYSITETNHGFKNETREATSIELDFWNRCAEETPSIPVAKVSNDIKLDYFVSNIFYRSDINIEIEEEYLKLDMLWIENEYESALYYKRGGWWSIAFVEFKKFRICCKTQE